MKPKIEIEVFIRSNHHWWDADGIQHNTYKARLKDNPGHWGWGRSQQAAVGDLIMTHPGQFGVTLTFPGKI